MILTILLLTLGSLLVYLYFFIREKLRYFEKRGIPYKKPVYLFDTVVTSLLGNENVNVSLTKLYDEFPGDPVVGMFHGVLPFILARDPQVIGTILTSEFSRFHDRGIYINEEANPLEGHLFNLSGNKWRLLRKKLTPTFTSGRIKGMLPLMNKCADVFIQDLDKKLGQDISIKDEFNKLTSHIIGSCTFGIETDSVRNEENDFTRLGIKIIQLEFKEFIRHMIRFFFPFLDRRFKFRVIPKEVNDFFFGLVKETMDYRKKTGYKRNDFLQLLLELREKGEIQAEPGKTKPGDDEHTSELHSQDSNEKLVLTDNVLTAQAGVFLVAGFDTTSTTLSFMCYYLSKNHEAQDKLRAEVRQAKEKFGDFTYEAFKEMPYLDAVMNESLRLWSPVGGLIRLCTESTTVCQGITIEKGVLVFIPTMAIHGDANYYPDPKTFKPERFIDSSPVPNTFLPFGVGPRSCIGDRFARLEIKLVMSKIMDRYTVETCAKMAAAEPVECKPRSFLMVPKNGLFCVFNKLNES